MKEQIRTLLEENPSISLVEVARTLHKDPQNQKCFREAYWQARAIFAEDIIRTICSDKGVWTILNSMDHMDHINAIKTICDMDHKKTSTKVMDHITSMDHKQEYGPYADMDHKNSMDHIEVNEGMDHKDLISKNDNLDKDLIEELPREFVYQGYKYWQGKSGAWRRRALTAPENYWEDVEKTKAESARAIFTLGL